MICYPPPPLLTYGPAKFPKVYEINITHSYPCHLLSCIQIYNRALTRPEHLVPPPRHFALMFEKSTYICCEKYVYIHVCTYMCIFTYTYTCVLICERMCLCKYMFIHVYLIPNNIFYLLIASVFNFEQPRVICSY